MTVAVSGYSLRLQAIEEVNERMLNSFQNNLGNQKQPDMVASLFFCYRIYIQHKFTDTINFTGNKLAFQAAGFFVWAFPRDVCSSWP